MLNIGFVELVRALTCHSPTEPHIYDSLSLSLSLSFDGFVEVLCRNQFGFLLQCRSIHLLSRFSLEITPSSIVKDQRQIQSTSLHVLCLDSKTVLFSFIEELHRRWIQGGSRWSYQVSVLWVSDPPKENLKALKISFLVLVAYAVLISGLLKLDEGVGVRIVNCSSLVDQSKLVSGTIVTLQRTTFTIIRILPPKVSTLCLYHELYVSVLMCVDRLSF